MATSDLSGSGSPFAADGASAGARLRSDGAPFHGVLFEQPQGAAGVDGREEPDFFVDLNLDQVLRSMTAGREEYELKPFFSSPLHEAAAVRYRHEVLRDLENPEVHEAIAGFADAFRRMREHLAQVQKLHYRCKSRRGFWTRSRSTAGPSARSRRTWRSET